MKEFTSAVLHVDRSLSFFSMSTLECLKGNFSHINLLSLVLVLIFSPSLQILGHSIRCHLRMRKDANSSPQKRKQHALITNKTSYWAVLAGEELDDKCKLLLPLVGASEAIPGIPALPTPWFRRGIKKLESSAKRYKDGKEP